jgi:putative SOS response-associated peptidase YedK
MEPIHDRMPVILKPEDYALSLDPGVTLRSRGKLSESVEDR